jgi:nitroimidazol reductase NimA-like FMN-containing flavoprotein (pyridoxamine 5'-phosphate oxidase superfamily)
MLNHLQESQARQLLRSSHLARLGCIVDGEPYIVPINYRYEEDFIYSHSLPGKKIEGLRQNSRACIQVDNIKSDLSWTSVLAFGYYEEIREPNQRQTILKSILNDFPMLTPVESAIVDDGHVAEVIVFRIRIERITGVSEGTASDEFIIPDEALGR